MILLRRLLRVNAYEVNLLGDYGGVSTTFNVGELSPFLEDETHSNLRTNPEQPEEDDVATPGPQHNSFGSNRLHGS